MQLVLSNNTSSVSRVVLNIEQGGFCVLAVVQIA